MTLDSDTPTPQIIPRAEHTISRRDIDRDALKVMYRLRDAGHSAYLVGGGVRDLLLGKAPKDFDISTDARPGQIRSLFKNSRIIGRRFRLVQVFFRGGKIVEVSTLRRRSEHDIVDNGEVLPSNNTFGTLPEDAFRRDLTINALFYEIENFTVIDYVGGVNDLQNKTIRIIGNPERRITRDPVRMLRAIRHASRSGFTIEEKTWHAIRHHREELRLCPVSRIRDELFKDLKSTATKNWALLAIASGLFQIILPCYEKLLPSPLENEGLDECASKMQGDLLDIFTVIDRLHAKQDTVPENMLLALLLIPWAGEEFSLFKSRGKKKGEFFQLSRKIRQRLDDVFIFLNIKNSSKEIIALLISLLPIFVTTHNRQGWPKWLVRKSYFYDCLQFFKIYREAAGGRPIDSLTVTAPRARRKRKSGRTARNPAMVEARGGIFGLKKK